MVPTRSCRMGSKNYAPSNNWMVWRSVSIKNSNSCVLSCFITISTKKTMGFYQLLPFWILSVKRNTTHMWIQCGYPWIHWSTDLTPEETYSRVCTKLLDGKPCPSRDSQWTKHGAVDVAGCHGMSGDLLLMIVFNYVFIHISICCVWIYTYGNIETALGECIFKLFNVFMHILVAFEYIDRIETHV